MTSYTPAADRPKNSYPVHKHTRSRPPVIPDLRFEYSYLRSVRPYVQIERSTSAVDPVLEDHEYERVTMPGDEEETERNDKALSSPTPSEIIHVQWGKLIWITIRDQVISPLFQGALWWVEPFGLCSIFDNVFDRAFGLYYFTQLGSRMGVLAHGRIHAKEGSGVGWLREWAKNLGLSRSNSDNSYPTPRTRL